MRSVRFSRVLFPDILHIHNLHTIVCLFCNFHIYLAWNLPRIYNFNAKNYKFCGLMSCDSLHSITILFYIEAHSLTCPVWQHICIELFTLQVNNIRWWNPEPHMCNNTSLTEIHQSALTDHVASNNHTIDWEGVTLPAKEPDWRKRGVKEAIFIRKAGTRAINREGGRHLLPEVFSKLLYRET